MEALCVLCGFSAEGARARERSDLCERWRGLTDAASAPTRSPDRFPSPLPLELSSFKKSAARSEAVHSSWSSGAQMPVAARDSKATWNSQEARSVRTASERASERGRGRERAKVVLVSCDDVPESGFVQLFRILRCEHAESHFKYRVHLRVQGREVRASRPLAKQREG